VRRTVITLPLVLAAALVLAGCSGDDPSAAPTPGSDAATDVAVCEAPAGDAVESIDVAGEVGSQPTVTFETPVEVDETQRTFVVEGDLVDPGDLVRVAYALYDGSTGEMLETFGWGEGEPLTPLRADYSMLHPGFAQTIGCAGAGSRVAGVVPGDDGATVVFVVDVLTHDDWTTDLPEIGGSDEAPTVTLAATAPKTGLQVAVLEEGEGEIVDLADTVSVHYLGTAWETGEKFDSSFDRGRPADFQVQGVVQGFSQALLGQKVGSKVLVTMPPALGYGEAGTSEHALAGLTLVFYIDIVAVLG